MDYKAKKVYQNKEVVSIYDKKRFGTFKGYFTNKIELYLISNVLRKAKVIHSDKILDIPCGTVRLSIYLSRKGKRS